MATHNRRISECSAIDVVVEGLRLWPDRTFGDIWEEPGESRVRVCSPAKQHHTGFTRRGIEVLTGSVFIHIELKLSWPIEYAVFKFLALPKYFVAYAPKAHVSDGSENQDAGRYFL